jgi:DNA-binding transcriptional LysR family regulator
MNLKQLEVFYAIMNTGSVTAAARSLNVTQPAVSNVLKHAEQQLRFSLFERKGGRLYPTPEASDLLPDVNEIFGRLGTLNRVVQEMRDGRTGRLVIATSPTLVHEFLPRAVALLCQRSPKLHVSVRSLPTALAVERVARREADMGIIYAPANDPGVDTEDLITTEIACVMPKTHPLAKKRYVDVGDLPGEAFISLGANTRLGTLIEDECRKANVPPPQIGVEAGSSVAACLMVSEGAGIALVDRATSSSGKFDDLVFRPFRPQVKVKVQLIYPRERPRSRAAAYLSEQLRRSVVKLRR